jgi:hypothetical protein
VVLAVDLVLFEPAAAAVASRVDRGALRLVVWHRPCQTRGLWVVQEGIYIYIERERGGGGRERDDSRFAHVGYLISPSGPLSIKIYSLQPCSRQYR